MSNTSETLIVGEARTLYSEWTDIDGDPTNATVILEVRDADDTIRVPSLTNPATGRYETVLTFDEVGNWYWEWTGSTSQGTKKCRGQVCVVSSWLDIPGSS